MADKTIDEVRVALDSSNDTIANGDWLRALLEALDRAEAQLQGVYEMGRKDAEAEKIASTERADILCGALRERAEKAEAEMTRLAAELSCTKLDVAGCEFTEAELEQAFREGRTDGINSVDRYCETLDTDDEAVAAWRERRAAERKP